jgi:hypothetical protein
MAAIRIWHQSMAELDGMPAYRDALAAHLPRVLPPAAGTEVVLHGLPIGTYPAEAAPMDVLIHPYAYHLTMNRVLENVVQADLVIPAEGVFNEVLFAQTVQRLDDVPVMDCVGVTFLYAEMLVNLRRRTGLEVGRRWEYARPSPSVIAHVRQRAGLPP